MKRFLIRKMQIFGKINFQNYKNKGDNMLKKLCFISVFWALFLVCGNCYTADLVSRSKVKLNNLEKIKGIKDSSKVAVAGAKATEQVNTDELYWAGKDEISDEEIALFKDALDKTEQKMYKEARTILKNLLEKYPKSAFSEDSVNLLKELEKKGE